MNSTALQIGREVTFGSDELIVSKTDLQGRITYVNDVFQRISGYSEEESVEQPHSFIRHPLTPGCIFKLLWDSLHAETEIFAYVANATKDGDFYWVFAHVTPSFDKRGQVTGYHSSRRLPLPGALEVIKSIYEELLRVESQHRVRREAVQASMVVLEQKLENLGLTYPEFIFSLQG